MCRCRPSSIKNFPRRDPCGPIRAVGILHEHLLEMDYDLNALVLLQSYWYVVDRPRSPKKGWAVECLDLACTLYLFDCLFYPSL